MVGQIVALGKTGADSIKLLCVCKRKLHVTKSQLCVCSKSITFLIIVVVSRQIACCTFVINIKNICKISYCGDPWTSQPAVLSAAWDRKKIVGNGRKIQATT